MHDAAVVGKVFWSNAIASMSGRPDEEVRQGLHELARKELIRPARRPSIENQIEYTFWHILVRDVAYGQIPRASRASKHRAAAEWIESVAGARVSDHAEILAFHYEEALSLARAAGSAGEEPLLSERAVEFLMMAGARAFHLDLEKSESSYRRALELVPSDDPRKGLILLQIARASGDRGGNDEAVRGFEKAIDVLQLVGDLAGTGEAQARLARILWRRGETARAHVLAEKAVELLETQPPGPELAIAYNEFAAFAMLAGSHEVAIRNAGRAIEVSEGLGLQGPIVRALDTRGVSLAELGNLEEGINDLQMALSMGTDLGLGYETATAYLNLASILEWHQGLSVSVGLLHEGAEFCRRRGLAFLEMWIRSGLASQLFALGRWKEASVATEEVFEWDRGRGESQLSILTGMDRVRILTHQGRTEEAAALVEGLLPQLGKSGTRRW